MSNVEENPAGEDGMEEGERDCLALGHSAFVTTRQI